MNTHFRSLTLALLLILPAGQLAAQEGNILPRKSREAVRPLVTMMCSPR